MTFSQLCQSAGLSQPSANPDINSIVNDSRLVQPGCLFVAIKGQRYDSHQDLAAVVKRGAVAVVVDQVEAVSGINIPYLLVENSTQALGLLWAAWLDWPSRKLTIAGITGTDGKTTTANLAYHLLTAAGVKTGLISTVGAAIGQRIMDTGLHVTSPNAPQLHQLLQKMVEEGLTHVVLEVTSHGIDQQRIVGVDFDLAVLTNLTSDHLDYHGDVEHYRAVKAKLFTQAKRSVLNLDDANYEYFAEASRGRVYEYSRKQVAYCWADQLKPDAGGSRWQLHIDRRDLPTRLPMPGDYNISNALAAATLAHLWGVDIQSIASHLPAFAGVAGRFEKIVTPNQVTVVIDFAHTTNALQQLLLAARPLRNADSQLWHVFGCAGERDATKRPAMGKVSADLCDCIILTSEDPRHEEVATINAAIQQGISQSNHSAEVQMIADRGQAIAAAINNAQPGDVVVITGKGHEQSLAIGDEELPWSDKQTVLDLIE